MVRFREEVEAAVEALLLQQVILFPAGAGWALGCDAEVPRAVAKLAQLAGPEALATAVVLVADETMLTRYQAAQLPAELAGAGLEIAADEFTQKVTRRLGHGVVAAPVAASYAEVNQDLVRRADHVVGWGQ